MISSEERRLLRHFLAAIAYRTQKAIRDAPGGERPRRRRPESRPVARWALLLGLMAIGAPADRSAAQVTEPGPRVAHGATYHAGLGMVVVFGGRDATGAELNDLWGWDGSRWHLLDDGAGGPAPRSRHAMGYDRARDRIVVHGGGTVDGDLDDSWAWTGEGWSRLPDGGPGPRSHHQMAYDPGSRAMLLYGGGRDGDGFGSDLWTLEDRGWARLDERLEPGRILAALIPAEDGVLLFGGLVRGGPRSRELWSWRAGRWSLLDRDGPAGLIYPGLARDAASDELVLFGGESDDGLAGETWIRRGPGWARDRSGDTPPARTEHALVYDEGRDVVVLFGGRTAAGPSADLWERDDGDWIRVR